MFITTLVLVSVTAEHHEVNARALPLLTLFGHAAISELSLLSGVKQKLDFEPAKGRFWRKAAVHAQQHLGVDKHESEMELVGD